MVNEVLGSRITELRIAGNLSQQEMAERMGISLERYVGIEKGFISIGMDAISQIR